MRVKVYSNDAKTAIKQGIAPIGEGEIIGYSSFKQDYTQPSYTTAIVKDDDGFISDPTLAQLQVIRPKAPVVTTRNKK